jgi:hypothetical protein
MKIAHALMLATFAAVSLGAATAMAQESTPFVGGTMPSYHVRLPWLDGDTTHASNTTAPGFFRAPQRSASTAPATRVN